MNVKNSLVQVKDKYNLSIFFYEIGKENKYKINVNHAGEKLPFDQCFVKSRSKGKHEPNFDDGANCWQHFIWMKLSYEPPARTVKNILIEGFFIKYFMSLITCTDAIFWDHLC